MIGVSFDTPVKLNKVVDVSQKKALIYEKEMTISFGSNIRLNV